MGSPRTIDALALSRRLAEPSPPLVVAVMTAAEHRSGRIPGSRLLHDVATFAREVPHERALVITCLRASSLSESWAYRLLSELGYRDVRVHRGGLRAWEAAGLPMERGP